MKHNEFITIAELILIIIYISLKPNEIFFFIVKVSIKKNNINIIMRGINNEIEKESLNKCIIFRDL